MTYLGPLPGGRTVAPDFGPYQTGVDPYLAKRCATLDCHGQIGRPLRLYSANGLRSFDAGTAKTPPYVPNVTGHSPITMEEQQANFVAVIGLEPETMARVVSDVGQNPERLLLLKKPLLKESHKGGQIMTDESDDGYACIASWLEGALVQDVCDRAASAP
jgi:hypothetical protein